MTFLDPKGKARSPGKRVLKDLQLASKGIETRPILQNDACRIPRYSVFDSSFECGLLKSACSVDLQERHDNRSESDKARWPRAFVSVEDCVLEEVEHLGVMRTSFDVAVKAIGNLVSWNVWCCHLVAELWWRLSCSGAIVARLFCSGAIVARLPCSGAIVAVNLVVELSWRGYLVVELSWRLSCSGTIVALVVELSWRVPCAVIRASRDVLTPILNS